MRFRLPLPPRWDDGHPNAWAAERRARKAYHAALDALVSGQVNETAVRKLAGLLGQDRSRSARAGMQQLMRVFGHVRWVARGAPVIARPPAPLVRVTVVAPPPGVGDRGETTPERLRARYAWALEWLRTRGIVASRGVALEWKVGPPGSARAA